jgi:hypothetical protein
MMPISASHSRPSRSGRRVAPKEQRALRTETTINNSHDFRIGRLLHNLPALPAIGFAANRRLLEVETLSQDCLLAEELFDQVTRRQVVNEQRVAALRFDDPRVMALLQVLCLFLLLPEGFRNATMRAWMAQALGLPGESTPPDAWPTTCADYACIASSNGSPTRNAIR